LPGMSTRLLCRLGYHRLGAWKEESLKEGSGGSSRTPRKRIVRVRTCTACGLSYREYSPQIGMLVSPPTHD
jgi:hypothetical protein